MKVIINEKTEALEGQALSYHCLQENALQCLPPPLHKNGLERRQTNYVFPPLLPHSPPDSARFWEVEEVPLGGSG